MALLRCLGFLWHFVGFEFLLELFDFWPDDCAAVAGIRIAAIVVLVVVLGFVKFGEWNDFGDDAAMKPFLRFSF